MAGGKLSPRQKMINLMYLVFIAMLALNMSKEVLTAFGLMDIKFKDTNAIAAENNAKTLEELNRKAEEKPQEFELSAQRAQKVSQISDVFYRYIGSLKDDILKGGKFEIDKETGKLPFESMDKGAYIDENWFVGDRLTKKGQEFLDKIEGFKKDIKNVVGDDVKYTKVIENLNKRFDTSPVKTSGVAQPQPWMNYHFEGFPAIASYTKLTAMQNDVKVTEANMFNAFLGNVLVDAVSLNKYKAIVLADKSAFFAGERFQGKVVLGKYANVMPVKLKVNGNTIDLDKAIDSTGAAKLDFNVGNVGEHEIDGEFTFIEDGKELPIPIIGNYVVVPRPNSATVSADKMNVVYRGLPNPMTISFAGVPDNKVSASASGLSKASGQGKYILKPGSGREITINVSATLDDGSRVSDKAMFRIKDIPKPSGTVSGKPNSLKIPRSNLEIATIGAMLEDFDFDLKVSVRSFKISVPGQPSITVSGNKLNSKAKSALRKAKRGSNIQIFDIKPNAAGLTLKEASPVVVELSN